MIEPTPPSASALSLALVRAERGVTLDAVEAETPAVTVPDAGADASTAA